MFVRPLSLHFHLRHLPTSVFICSDVSRSRCDGCIDCSFGKLSLNLLPIQIHFSQVRRNPTSFHRRSFTWFYHRLPPRAFPSLLFASPKFLYFIQPAPALPSAAASCVGRRVNSWLSPERTPLSQSVLDLLNAVHDVDWHISN